MRTRTIVSLATLAALGVACAGVERPDCSAGPGAPAIAITYIHFGGGPGSRTGPELEVAVWPDGRIVWEADASQPEAELREARIDPRPVSSLLVRLRDEQVFEAGAFRHAWFGPDSDYIVIQVVLGTECVRLKSWHEGYEANPKLAVVNGAVILIGDESREAMLAQSSPEWLHFLAVWREMRSTVAGLIPASGEPCAFAVDLKGLW